MAAQDAEGAPLVTVGVLSFNRLRYLRALLDSARECIDYPNVQWLVVDGASVEPGLREYLESLDDVEVVSVESGRLADLMNAMLEHTRGDYLMMLPDRVQFIVRGDWMSELVEIARDHPGVGHIGFDAQRRRTLAAHFLRAYVGARGRYLWLPFLKRPYRTLRTRAGSEFIGYGRVVPAVNVGSLSFCRTSILRDLGAWTTTMDWQLTNDAGLGTETEMLARFARSGTKLERYLMRLPVMAPIVTDPRGTTAKIRCQNRRYGRYIAPPDGRFYYRIWDMEEARRAFGAIEPAASFEDMVEPLGFDLPLDANGDMMKVSVIRDDEPYELVDQPPAN